MTEPIETIKNSTLNSLASRGYWVAIAGKHLDDGFYSKAVELCQNKIEEFPQLLSARIIYARALFHAGQLESAEEQFYNIISRDPENIVALKYLGDIKFTKGEEFSSLMNYQRILELDKKCCGIKSMIKDKTKETTHSITLTRKDENKTATLSDNFELQLKDIPFLTETMGDLYLSQGHNRLAIEVFQHLHTKNQNPRYIEKLNKAKAKLIKD